MRKILIILLLVLMTFPLTLKAGIYGSLRGKVLDEQGKPVIGATILVTGTNRGTFVKNPDGSFTVLNITAGTYTIKITAIGYREIELKDVAIHADQSTSIDVKLSTSEVMKKEVVVYGNKMVNHTEIGATSTISNKEMESVAREGIASMVTLTAGVEVSGGNYAIRNSRPQDTKIKIDGVDRTNQFTGGGTNLPTISEYDTQEIDVKKGGMSADYGDAMGGVINTVTKTGRSDKYEGYVRYRTDVPAAFGSQASGKALVYDPARDAYKAVPSGPGAQLQGPGQNRFASGVGGPIPGLDGSTFYLFSNYTYRKYNTASYKVFDPAGNNLGQMPNDQSWSKYLGSRFSFKVTSAITINAGFDYGSANTESSAWAWLYSNDQGWVYNQSTGLPKLDANGNPVLNGVPERIMKQAVTNDFVTTAFVKINHTLNQTSFYELTVSNETINEEISKRTDANDPSYFGGFNVWTPQDNKTVNGSILSPGHNKIVDQYEIIKFSSSTVDGYNNADFTQRNPLTGYIEGPGDNSSSNNPYGRDYAFYSHGNSGGFDFRKSNTWEIMGNYTSIFEGEFRHLVKAGFDFNYFTLYRDQNGNPWDGNPFFDVYTNEYGGNIYASDAVGYDRTSKPYNPIKAAAYLLDQISYKGIVISPSLRFDMYLPQAEYRTQTDKFVSITSDTGFAQATMKYQLSPRLNVTYPITDKSNLSINYGMFFQMPVLSSMYDGFATIQLRGNQILGDPNMDAQRTNQYDITYRNEIVDNLGLTISAYYKDIYNQLGTIYVPAVPIPYYQYAVSEYGNIKGLEFELKKRPTLQDNIGVLLSYTLAQSVSTSSAPGDNYMQPVDPYTQITAFPLADFPTSNDIRHRIKFILDFIWANNQGPSIGGIQPLENSTIDFTTFWNSGAPYTSTDLNGRALNEINSQRGPSYWATDMQLNKSFNLKDWFGDSWGNTQIELSVTVYNVFNLNGPTGLYTSTNDPDDQGLNFRRQLGNFSSISFYKNADFANAASIATNQYDNFGNRLYSKNADADGNGIVTQQEKYDAFMKQITTVAQFQSLYQTPRSVFFTVYFKF